MAAYCKEGSFAIVVDRETCEAAAECVKVCPFDVFDIRRMADEEFKELPFFVKLRARRRDRKTAYATFDKCHACGLCVSACPKRALTLATNT